MLFHMLYMMNIWFFLYSGLGYQQHSAAGILTFSAPLYKLLSLWCSHRPCGGVSVHPFWELANLRDKIKVFRAFSETALSWKVTSIWRRLTSEDDFKIWKVTYILQPLVGQDFVCRTLKWNRPPMEDDLKMVLDQIVKSRNGRPNLRV